jgi:hypothetical protein
MPCSCRRVLPAVKASRPDAQLASGLSEAM